MSHRSSNNDSHSGLATSTRRKDKSIVTDSSSRNYWWQSEDIDLGECPITLEPLSTLPYPPFALSTSTTANEHDAYVTTTSHPRPACEKMPSSSFSASHDYGRHRHHQVSYFDGLALATYTVSRGIFQNPLTRQNLTMQDCRRLDEYLVEYCYRKSDIDGNIKNSDDGLRFGNTYRNSKFSVAEAFALRNSVRVDMSRSGIGAGRSDDNVMNNNNVNVDVDQGAVQRMNALRNAATAALAGLFVYSNRQSGPVEDGTMLNDPISTDNSIMSNPLIRDWGFDLTRTVENTAQEGGQGWTVIDDDEAAVVATRRYAYQTVQEAFPPLPSSADLSDSTSTTTTATRCAGTTAPVAGPDEHLIERVRALAVQDREAEMERVRLAELAQQRHLQMALIRREERRKLRAARFAQGVELYENQRIEEEEVKQARAEIEAWREDQWERLRLISERQIQLQKKRNSKLTVSDTTTEAGEESMSETEKESDMDVRTEPNGAALAQDIEAKKKAKAAAKRKRAKERKKAQKDEETSTMERIKQVEAEQARKAASTRKCDVCGQGILDCGYQKFDQTLCSPKCARAAKPNHAAC